MAQNRCCITSMWSTLKALTLVQVLVAVTYITSGLIVNIIQAILYCTLRPWNPRLYRKINYYITYTLNCQIVFLVEWWSQSRTPIVADPDDVKKYFGKEHAILILNHTYEIDWVVGWVLLDRVGVLGNARVMAKKILAYAPIIGWSWKFQEVVFLERNWEKDRRNLGKQLNNLVNYPDPMWLTLFPEGTRFTKQKHAASMEVARQKGLPELKHHLLPRTKGFVSSMPHLREKVAAVYDIVVGVDPKSENEPSMYSILKGREVRTKIMVRRVPMEEVPMDDVKCAEWLHKRYQEKDQLLDNFIRTGKFLPEDSPMTKLPEFRNFLDFELPRRFYSLLNIIFWGILIVGPLLCYIITIFTSGNYLKMGIVVGLIITANVGLMKLIDLTRISKASSYGKDSNPSSPKLGAKANNAKSNDKQESVTNGETNGKAKAY